MLSPALCRVVQRISTPWGQVLPNGLHRLARQVHPAFSSALKYYGAELNKRRHELLMAAGGSDALEWESERSNNGFAARTWLRTKGNSIEGGTSEVNLNVVAKRVLGLRDHQ